MYRGKEFPKEALPKPKSFSCPLCTLGEGEYLRVLLRSKETPAYVGGYPEGGFMLIVSRLSHLKHVIGPPVATECSAS